MRRQGRSHQILGRVRRRLDRQPVFVRGADRLTALHATAAERPKLVVVYSVTPPPTHGRVRAAISAATSGDNTLVAAVSGKKIKVLSLTVVGAGEVEARLESGAGGTALTEVMTLVKGVPMVWPAALPGDHYVETAAGALLNLELGGAVQVSGCLLYYVE